MSAGWTMRSKVICFTALAAASLTGCGGGSGSSKSTAPAPTALAIASTTPTVSATCVSESTAISVAFNEALSAQTVTNATFTVTASGNANVAGTVTYTAATDTATFTPSAILTANTVYTATATTGITSAGGSALSANYIWTFSTGQPTNGQSTACVDFGTTFQTIRGFGASTAFDAGLVSAGATALFGNTGSAQLGLTLLRVRIDPAGQVNWGTELSNAQLATSLGANVFATPWTPPASMKSNTNIVGGSLSTSSYAAYATYLESYVTYMKANGVNLYAISMQNEPDFNATYEGCLWTGAQMDTWVAQNASVLTTKLIMPESYSFNPAQSDPALNDPNAVGYISIVGGHLYGSTPTYYTNAISKGKDVWMTEFLLEPAGTAIVDPSISDGLTAAKLIHDSMTIADYNAYVWWRAQNSGTGTTLTTDDGLVDPNNIPNNYGYAIGHYAKFVRPGYVRTNATYSPTTGVYVSAYMGSGHYVIVVINQSTSSVSQTFTIENQALTTLTPYQTTAGAGMVQQTAVPVSNNSFTYTLPAQSITSFVQ